MTTRSRVQGGVTAWERTIFVLWRAGVGVLGILYLHDGMTWVSGWIVGVTVFRYHGWNGGL